MLIYFDIIHPMTLPEGIPNPHFNEAQIGAIKGIQIARDLFGSQVPVSEKVTAAFQGYLEHIRQLGKVDRVITIFSPDPEATIHVVGVYKRDGFMEHGTETVDLVRSAENLRWTLADVREACISHVNPSDLESYLEMIHSSLKFRNDLKLTSYPIEE